MTKRSAARQEFLADIVTTAVEGGIGYWSQVSEYRWYFPTLDGGTAEPGPDGTANAYAVVHEEDDDYPDGYKPDGVRVTVDAIAKAYGILRAGEVKYVPAATRQRLLAAYRECDAGDLDAGDADTLVQLAVLGEVVYG